MIIPLVAALVLAILSFICSVFIVLRIIIPTLPPNPLSGRVPPSEFGLPNFRKISIVNQGLLWLASLDLLALAIFIWQAVDESLWGQNRLADSLDPASSARLWFALTIRQTCLFFISAITLLHIRLGQPVSFGGKQWMLWAPTVLLIALSTSMAVVLAGAYVPSLFIGLTAYTSTLAVLTSFMFIFLLITVRTIKRNLDALDERVNPWPPTKEMEEKPRPSFATEDVDVLRDGASWITSDASSHRHSMSAWSFSTYHTAAQHGSVRGSRPSIPPKSSFWFKPLSTPPGQESAVPPVPPLPSPYRSRSVPNLGGDPDPFRRDIPVPYKCHVRGGSQGSWLTSPSASQVTLSAWSYPTSNLSQSDLDHVPNPSIRPVTPGLANAQVLGGYGYAQGCIEAEKGLAASNTPSSKIEVSAYHTLAWLVVIWLPLLLSLPYLITTLPGLAVTSPVIPVLFVLSATISSPLMALSLVFRTPLPIPTGLFESQPDLPSGLPRSTSPASTLPGLPSGKFSHEYRRSSSVTVVEGRRSGDVWIDNGDAVESKSKIGRVLGMMVPKPRLAVLPPEGGVQDGEVTPPLPMQTEDSASHDESAAVSMPLTQESEVEVGRTRKNSKASSNFSCADDSLTFASRIMVAQRHYSAMAHTVVVPASPDSRHSIEAGPTFDAVKATGAEPIHSTRPTSHLRSRSVSWVSGPVTPSSGGMDISPPPSFPLPPTPPNVRAARLAQLGHKKSFSSGFSFGAVDDMDEIDAMTAGVLPLLVPGLKVGPDMRIKQHGFDGSPPVTLSKGNKAGKTALKAISAEFATLEDGKFPSPEVHSTPARTNLEAARNRRISGHKKNHFSLPSLGLGRDGIHSITQWKAEISRALETQIGKYRTNSNSVDLTKRATFTNGELAANARPQLDAVREEHDSDENQPIVNNGGAQLTRSMSARSLGLRADVPHDVDTARSSIATINATPPSAASTVTLFEFEAGLEDGPQAQSTPHHSLSNQNMSNYKPFMIPEQPTRRSSIKYIKSDDNEAPPAVALNTMTPSTPSRFSQWSSRAVRPLIPKASKPQRKNSNAIASSSETKPGPSGKGLRQLTLLKDRDTNALPSVDDSGVIGATLPLSIGKKQKSRRTVVNDENVGANTTSQNRNLKPLQLVRSETSKMRAILRKGEVLPNVIVRPPSEAEQTSITYTFGQAI